MRKILVIFAVFYFVSHCLHADPGKPTSTCHLAEMQQIIDTQRKESLLLIKNNGLSDSVNKKPYCVFYMSGCRGIGAWMVVVSNQSDYHIYFTDSFEAVQNHQYKTICLSKEDEDVQLLFSQQFLKESKMSLNYKIGLTTFYYFGLFNENGNLIFDFNQSLLFKNSKTQRKILSICLKFILPDLI